MTPRIPLLLLVAFCALSAEAAEPPKEVKEPQARPARKYRRARESVSHDGAIGVTAIQCHLRAGDGGTIGGADHAASNRDACWNAPGQCLVLLPQLEDMILDGGAQVSPHVYAVADAVLGAAARKYGSFSKLDAALAESSVPGSDTYQCYGRTSANLGAHVPAAAARPALEILRRSLASSRVISGTLLGDPKPLAAHAARWAGEFDDAGAYLEKELKARLGTKEPPAVLAEVVKTLGERVRNDGTGTLLLGLFLQQKNGKRALDEALKLRILSSLRMTVSTVHKMGHDKDRDSVWAPEDVKAGNRYFVFACGLLADEGCVDANGKDTGAGKPVCAAARELLIFAPKPHKATCDKKSGEPLGPKCK